VVDRIECFVEDLLYVATKFLVYYADNDDNDDALSYIAPPRLAVRLSGNALASINVVALCQTRLVPGWVTVCGQVNHLGV